MKKRELSQEDMERGSEKLEHIRKYLFLRARQLGQEPLRVLSYGLAAGIAHEEFDGGFCETVSLKDIAEYNAVVESYQQVDNLYEDMICDLEANKPKDHCSYNLVSPRTYLWSTA